MRLVLLVGARYRVYAEAPSNDGQTEFELQLESMQRKADAAGIASRLRRFAMGGRQEFSDEVLHKADEKGEIWQLRKGDLRAFLFFDGNEIIVVSTVAVKKGRKANPAEVDAARRLRKRYFEAKRIGRIEYGGEK